MRFRHLARSAASVATALVLSLPGQARAQFAFFEVASSGDAAPAEVGGTFTAFFQPSISNSGRIAFKALVAGATNPECPVGAQCEVLVQTKQPGFELAYVTNQGHNTGIGTLQTLDDLPLSRGPGVYHSSCSGPGEPIQGILENNRSVDQILLAGSPCFSKFGQIASSHTGVSYWRALLEAVVFLPDELGAVPTPVVTTGAPTMSRVLGFFMNLAKARSSGWETMRRVVAMNSINSIAFLSQVAGTDVDPACLGADGFCDAIFVASADTGDVVIAAAKGDPIETGGTIARFCGPPAINDGGDVVFRALTDPTDDCDSLTGSGQGIYRVGPPFLPGTIQMIADATTFFPDETTGGSYATDLFSDPVSDSLGNVYFRAGDPLPGAAPGEIIRSAPPFGPASFTVVAAKAGLADPANRRFTGFAPDAPAVNSRGQMALLTEQGVFLGSSTSILVADCRETILRSSLRATKSYLRAIGLCAKKMVKGKIPQVDCWTEYANSARKAEVARDTMIGTVEQFCPEEVMPFIDPCDPARPTASGEASCLVSIHEAVVRDLFKAWVPQLFP